MGYTTEFDGEIGLDKPLTVAHMRYLQQFASTRRQKRDEVKTAAMDDPIRKRAGLPIGDEAGFYVGDSEENVIDGNSPPAGQPGLWCQWIPTEDGDGICWDGGEKFGRYTEWLAYIIGNFLEPWGYVANGQIKWNGEERGDFGVLVVKDNVVTRHEKVLEVDEDSDGPEEYSHAEVIEALESILASAKSALKNIKGGKGDPKGDLNDLHGVINDLFHSVDEGMADLGVKEV
jgi:hypothetical protein